jgi:glycogen operon protein
MNEEDWHFPEGRFLSYVLAPVKEGGEPLFVVVNGVAEDVEFTFPEWPAATKWQNLLDTANGEPQSVAGDTGSPWAIKPSSILVFAGRP